MEGTCSNIKDPRIDADSSSITRIIHIGLLCVQTDETDRPTMEEVVAMLTNTSSLALPIPKISLLKKVKFSDVLEILPSDCISMSDDYDYDSGAGEDFISELHPR